MKKYTLCFHLYLKPVDDYIDTWLYNGKKQEEEIQECLELIKMDMNKYNEQDIFEQIQKEQVNRMRERIYKPTFIDEIERININENLNKSDSSVYKQFDISEQESQKERNIINCWKDIIKIGRATVFALRTKVSKY